MAMLSKKYSAQIGLEGLREVAGQIVSGTVLLGLDSGKKRWGMAISDDALRVSLPLVQYDRRKYAQDLAYLADIVDQRQVGGVVIGLPLHMNAEPSPRAQAASQLGRDIEQQLSLPVAFWDERMSSVAMQRAMIEEADLSRKKQHKSLDKLAAQFILQGALDALQFSLSEQY